MPAETGTADFSVDAAREEAAYSLGVQAYLWGKPLLDYGRAVPAAIRAGGGELNRFCKTDLAGTHTGGQVVTNICGFWDVRGEPVAVVVPEQTGQGDHKGDYVVQFGDMFETFFHTLGGRQGPQPGLYVITGPGWEGALPEKAIRLPARTRMGVCVVQMVSGMSDAGFRMTPLSFHTRGFRGPPVPLAPYMCDAPPALVFFDRLGYWLRMAFPPWADDSDSLLGVFHQIGLSATHGFRWRTLDDPVRRGLARAIRSGEEMVEAGRAQPYSPEDDAFPLHTALTGYRLGALLAEREVRTKVRISC